MTDQTVGEGAKRALAMRRAVQRWCRKVLTAAGVAAESSVPAAWVPANTRPIASAATPPASKPGEPTVGRTQAESACAARALEGARLHRRCRRMRPFPD